MNILLIKADGLSFHTATVAHPLGLMYLSSYLKKYSPDTYNIKLVDMRTSKDLYRQLPEIISDLKPAIVAISALTQEADSLHTIAKMVKELEPTALIAVGGPHPTSFTKEVLKDKNIDCVIIGEGELTFTDLVKKIKQKKNLRQIKGIAFMHEGKCLQNPSREYIEDLDTIPFPDWSLIDISTYEKLKGPSPLGFRRYMALFTSRSCPYHCIYCHRIFGKGFRARSPENILQEIEILYTKHNVTEFDIIDDIFNINKERAEKICDMIVERKYKIDLAFPVGLRSDRLHNSTLKKMHAAGTKYISFAIESATPRVQKMMKKNLNLEKVTKAIDYAVRLGIYSNGFFMIGFPTETKKEIQETVKFALSSNLHTASFFMVTPFEGTEMYDLFKDRIEKLPFNHSDYHYHRASLNLSEITDSALVRIQKDAYKKFYFNPSRIPRILLVYLKTGNLKSLLYYFRGIVERSFSRNQK